MKSDREAIEFNRLLPQQPKLRQRNYSQQLGRVFLQIYFCHIDEERFALLYSDNYSRSNVPVNIMIGLLTLKELKQWSDEELISAFYFDYRVQYDLNISDFDKERICINTTGNFRKRLYQYYKPAVVIY